MAFTPRTETYIDVASLTDPFDITVDKPADTANGDILFCCFSWYGFGTIDSVPSGWNLLGENVANFDRYAFYYKIASSEPGSWDWSFTATGRVRAVCSCYTGGDFNAADPIDVVSNTAYRTSNTICRAASMTVAAANSPLVFWGCVYSVDSRTFTKPSVPTTDWIEDDDAGSTTSRFWTEICSFIWSGSGATGDMDATINAVTTMKHAFAVALKPSAAIVVTPGTLSLTITQYAPILKEVLTPTTLSLTTTTYVPVLKEVTTPSTLSLTTTGYAPILKEVLTPSTLSLSTMGYAPVLREVLTPTTLSLSLTGYAPVLNTGIVIGLLELVLTGYAPTLGEEAPFRHAWGIIFG